MAGYTLGLSIGNRHLCIPIRRDRGVSKACIGRRLRKEHPGQASGADRLNRPVSSSESANTSPGVPAYPGTPINTPGENGRFGPEHGPPRPSPLDQRAATEKITIDDAAEQQRAPSHLAFHLPKAQNAARSAAATPGLITAHRVKYSVAASGTTEAIASEKGTIPSGFPIPKGRYPGQFLNFGPGLTAASTAAGEPTTGNDQHVPDPRAKDAGNPLSSATQNLHTSHDESAGDNPRPDFSVPPENPKISPAKTPVAGTSASTGSGARNLLESATPHSAPDYDNRHPAGFGLISSEILAAPEGSGGRPNVSHDRGSAMLCCIMLYYAMLCYAMLYYSVLCYAMLCYAMLYYAVLCYAILCKILHHCPTAPTSAVNWPTVGPNAASAREVTQGREPASSKCSQHA